VIAETEQDLIKRLNEWKDNMENRGMRVNINKTTVMISGERQKPVQKAARWPSGVGWLVGWSLTSLFSTNTAIAETSVVYVAEVLVVIQYSVLVSEVGTQEV